MTFIDVFQDVYATINTSIWKVHKGKAYANKAPAREFSQTLPRFSTGYGDTDNMSYFFYKIIIISVNKEKDDVQSAYCEFSQLGDSQTALLTSFSCFIAL